MTSHLEAQRILIYGVTGSGKTTLAARLSELTEIPWHSVDDLTWEPGWNAVPLEIQRQRVEDICRQEAWILDTAYGTWVDIPLKHVQVIVGLDYARWFSLLRLVRRCILRIVDQRTVCNGNRESIRNLFGKDSIVLWHFKSFSNKRKRMVRWEQESVGPIVVRLRSQRELDLWLENLITPGKMTEGVRDVS